MICRRAAGLLLALPLALGLSTAALAEDGSSPQGEPGTTVAKRSPPSNPIGAAPVPSAPQGLTEPQDAVSPSTTDEGAGWEAAVEAAQAPTPLIGEAQNKAVQRINAYFNDITNLQGSFDQVDSNDKHTSGRFYVQRPGKIRFDYAPPSALRIVADGHFLAIEDSDLKTVEKYPIGSTPFRLLLADAVDLARDARIVGVESDQGTLAVTLEDKGGDAAGSIKLVFDTTPELRLRRWLITDAQGLTTTVTINDIISGRKVAADFFNSTDSFQPFR